MINKKKKIIRKTIKDTLKNIKKDDVNYNKFDNIISRANDIYFICSYFYNAYLKKLHEMNGLLPITDSNFFRMCFKAISKKSNGPKPKGNNSELLTKLEKFFDEEFVYIIADKTHSKKYISEHIEEYKYDAVNLSYIIDVFREEMEISMKNNIILNFFKYVHQYVNQHFIKKTVKYLTKQQYKSLSKIEQIKYNNERTKENTLIKEIKSEILKVKNDLCDNNNPLTSHSKYHSWINENKKIIFPIREKESLTYEEDIHINCYKYLKHMMLMNSVLEKNEMKMFSSTPLRTEIYDKYVTFNYSSLKDIFGKVNSNLTDKEIWNKYFKINEKKYNLKNYSFNFQISTDGFAVSLNFIRNDQIPLKQKKSENMLKKCLLTKHKQTTQTLKEIEEDKKLKIKKEKQLSINKMEEQKKYKKNQQIIFKTLPKEEQEKIRLTQKLKKNQFEYIEDALKNPILREELKKAFEEGKIKVVDPGCRAPMTILGKGKLINKTGKKRKGKIFYTYTSGARINATKRLKYNKLIENKKKKVNIYHLSGRTLKDLENELSFFNSKTMKLDKFFEYCKKKLVLRKFISETNFEQIHIPKEIKIPQKINKNKVSKSNKNKIPQKINKNKVSKSNKIKEDCEYKVNTNLIMEELNKINNEILQKIDKDIINNINSVIIMKEQNDIEKENKKNGEKYNKYIRKLKWFGYINKQRHEEKLLNELEKIYGKDAIFAFGDWSSSMSIKRISMPNMGMKRLLEKRFKVYLLDEYKTSKCCWKTKKEPGEKEKTHVEIKKTEEKEGIKYESVRKIHSLLTFKMSEKEYGIINRDYNATQNMYTIIESLVTIGARPIEFTRTKKIVTKKPIKVNKKVVTNL